MARLIEPLGNEKLTQNLVKFLRGVFVGGFFALVSLGFFIALVLQLQSDQRSNFFLVTIIVGIGCSSLAALWGAGLWGHWLLLLFFALLPIVLIVDFSLNPLFPAGSILMASVLCWPQRKKQNAS